MSSKKDYYHDKGEQDRSEGQDYQAPHGHLEQLMGFVDGSLGSQAEDNVAYRQGWTNTDEQISGKK